VSTTGPVGHEPPTDPADHLAACLHELAGVAGAPGQVLADGLAALAELDRQLSQTRASLHIAEESVVRQKELLKTATEMIEEARDWARRSIRYGQLDAEASAETEDLEVAPAWLTAPEPRRVRTPARPTTSPDEFAAHALRLAALDRVIADVEEEWGTITDEDIAAAPERLRRRVPPPA
jgi:hypothetical protein